MTGDRDALQLVSPGGKVIITKKGISDVQIFDVDEVKREYGLTPLKIIDMKALMGDSSDNIPGVPGEGEKTALKKLKENLTKYGEQALLSKRLATIVQDAPVDINVEDCCYELRYSGDLHAFMEELGFYSIIEKLGFK